MTRWLTAFLFLSMHGPSLAQDKSTPAESSGANQPTIDELLLFFPAKFPAGDWSPEGLHYEDVYFRAEDGTKLHGWYCPCDSPRATLLIAHGNAGHVAARAKWLSYLQSTARVAVFMFDYRGYGRSKGTPTVEGALADAKAARGKLCELAGIENSEMILMGESLGGAIAVQLAADSPPRGLVLQSTFSSLRDIADVHYPALSWLVPRAKLNSKSSITAFEGPLLQSHGTADQIIPLTIGRDLFRAANDPKWFVAVEHRGHNDWLTTEYLRRLNEFIDDVGQRSEKPPNN